MMKLVLLPVLVLALYSCETKTVKNDGGIIIELSADCSDTTDIIAVISSRLSFMEFEDFKVYSTGNSALKVEIPGSYDTPSIERLLLTKGELSFYETYENKEIFNVLAEISKKLSQSADSTTDKNDSLFLLLYPNIDNTGSLMSGAELGNANSKDTSLINKHLNEFRSLLPRDFEAKWKKNENNEEFCTLIGINKGEILNGENENMVSSAELDKSYGNTINFTFTNMYAAAWEKMTKENIGKAIAILIDGQLYSYPIVQTEIKEGNCSISGNFELTEAKILAAILNSGTLPCEMNLISLKLVKP